MFDEKVPKGSHLIRPTLENSMLFTVRQDDPNESENENEASGDVSEDELDMMLATMGTTSLKESELALLQDDIEVDGTEVEAGTKEAEPPPASDGVPATPVDKQGVARRAVKKLLSRFKKVK